MYSKHKQNYLQMQQFLNYFLTYLYMKLLVAKEAKTKF